MAPAMSKASRAANTRSTVYPAMTTAARATQRKMKEEKEGSAPSYGCRIQGHARRKERREKLYPAMAIASRATPSKIREV